MSVERDDETPASGMPRRVFLVRAFAAGAGFGLLSVSPEIAEGAQETAPKSADFWWHRYPTFMQTQDVDAFTKSLARMDIHGIDSDPTWGRYAQRTTELDGHVLESYRAMKARGGRVITWIEGFGDCMVYAISLERRPDGSFEPYPADPIIPLPKRNHWDWGNRQIPQGNALRWAGLHSIVNREDYLQPMLAKHPSPLPQPTYPDGRLAVGWLQGGRYPLNARIYDACGSKNINGELHPSCETPSGVNDVDPATGKRKGPIEGLYPAIFGKDDVPGGPGVKKGDPIYAGALSVHKDLSAPFWREYARASVREIVAMGLDGVWCDNYSPWDNFGFPPIEKAFGDWSVYRFHKYLHGVFIPQMWARLGVPNPAEFDVRRYLKSRAKAFGAKDPAKTDDPAWHDPRWLDDPIWNAFKAFRQQAAQTDLRAFYRAIHEEAEKGGRPDFGIGGNDVPLYGLGWVRDEWQDMINTETSPGWHMGSGSRGILIPPVGKMAIMYRAALEHQKGPYSLAWYYLNDRFTKYQQKPEIGKVLVAEAFANGAFLLCMPDNKTVAGTLESHAWWNGFVARNEEKFGKRVARADVGVLFSPDNQLALLTPGGYPNLDRQPHIFGHHGWATAMIDGHIPYRVITDWKVTSKNLAPLHTFIVPDAECLDEAPARVIAAWVRAGGRLVVTGPTGMREGPTGHFRRHDTSVLGDLLGIDMRRSSDPLTARPVGNGTVLWSPSPLGMSYYLHDAGRGAALPEMMRIAGPSALVEAQALPTTVGLSLWSAADGSALFADLVNYNLDADADVVHPAENLTFRLRLPKGWTSSRGETISPDSVPSAEVEFAEGWAVVRLPRLEHFVGVRVSA